MLVLVGSQIVGFLMHSLIFSSPEAKAHGELIGWACSGVGAVFIHNVQHLL